MSLRLIVTATVDCSQKPLMSKENWTFTVLSQLRNKLKLPPLEGNQPTFLHTSEIQGQGPHFQAW